MAKPISSLDHDPQETREWLEALEGVLDHQGTDRARYLLARLSARSNIRLGDTVSVAFDPERLHFFDGESGDAIWD